MPLAYRRSRVQALEVWSTRAAFLPLLRRDIRAGNRCVGLSIALGADHLFRLNAAAARTWAEAQALGCRPRVCLIAWGSNGSWEMFSGHAGHVARAAEGLSGLAKAFFYAGSRALLVSHWPVASASTVKLITGMFAEAAAHPEIGRAEALRRAMLKLMNDPDRPEFAHPAFWAPFVVVGEGGK